MFDTLFSFFDRFFTQFILFSDIGGLDWIIGFFSAFLSYTVCVFLFFIPILVLYLFIKILTRN